MICYFADSVIFSPNVLPLSLLTIRTGSLLVAFLSHHVTYKLLAAATICASCDCEFEELLRFTFSPNVLPQSVLSPLVVLTILKI